jgi:hypothetical protein
MWKHGAQLDTLEETATAYLLVYDGADPAAASLRVVL